MKWLLLAPLFIAIVCQGAVHTAAGLSEAQVQAAIDLCSDGDTARLPDGSATWTSGVTISGKGITINPATRLGVSLTQNGSGTMFAFTRDSTHVSTLAGVRFVDGSGAGRYVDISGSGRPVILCSNFMEFADSGVDHCVKITGRGSILHNNAIFVTPDGENIEARSAIWVKGDVSAGEAEWDLADTIGTGDITGEVNLYFEDNFVTNITQQTVDCDEECRLVFRHNTMKDSAVVVHGGDTSCGGGGRQWEFYDNTFIRVDNGFPINRWFYLRGATGVIMDNVIPEAGSPDGMTFPNKVEIDFTIQYLRRDSSCPLSCWGVDDPGNQYPAPLQIGQNTDTPDSIPDKPVIVSGNTGDGTSSGNFITRSDFTDEPQCTGTPDVVADYVQPGRDYTNANVWGYTKFTYPHPLRSEAGGGDGETVRIQKVRALKLPIRR